MINTIKKEKTTQGLALVAKLMGLAVIFNLASCGCGGKEAETKLSIVANDVKDGSDTAKFGLKNEGTDKISLKTLKLNYDEVATFSDKTFGTKLDAAASADNKFEIQNKAKDADIVGKTVEELTKQAELEPGKTVDIEVTLVPGSTVQSATMNLVVKNEKDEEKAKKEFKWNVTP